MHPYIHIGTLVFDSYTVFNNLGTLLGLFAMYLILSVKSKKTSLCWMMIAFTLAVMFIGAVPAHYLKDLFGGAGPGATHFLGRVLVYALLLPLFLRAVCRGGEGSVCAWNSAAAYIMIQHFFNRTACTMRGCCGGRFIPALKMSFPTRGFEALSMLAGLMWLMRSMRSGKNRNCFYTVCLWFSAVIFISEFFMDQPDIGRVLHLTSVQYGALLLAVYSASANFFIAAQIPGRERT